MSGSAWEAIVARSTPRWPRRLKHTLDDLSARRAAKALDSQVMGVVGLLLLAKRHKLLGSIQPRLDLLLAADFRILERLNRNALNDAGEL